MTVVQRGGPRTRRFGVVVGILVTALVASLFARAAVSEGADELVVVHWANGHLTRDGLLPDMADRFNADRVRTSGGRPIKVVVVPCDSAVQAKDLVARVKGAGRSPKACGTDDGPSDDPAVVTPQSRDWLVDVNHRAGTTVVDLAAASDIARTWLGIVTYRAMAECLGWPEQELGYGDILAMRADAAGWTKFPCAKAEWGRRPRLAFTNPMTSTSGRNVLVSLYAMATGKPLAELTVEDVDRPDVVTSVQRFQGLVDHYLPGTIPLNSKIVQGPKYGHFFLMPEDNLANLYLGNEKAISLDGTERTVPAVKDLVMIYPKEGSVLNAHAAGLVTAPWVSREHGAAAARWVEFLHADAQQRAFIAAGFRPAGRSELAVDARTFASWGLSAAEPSRRIEPADLRPDVLDKIVTSWSGVKNPAIVTFVVDTSGSMAGEPIEEVKQGLLRVVDAMADADGAGSSSQVGLVTFADDVRVVVPPAPIREAKFGVADAVDGLDAGGSTALYDGVARGIELSSATVGDERTTRAVVVLSDGEASRGRCLHEIVAMHSRTEVPIREFCGHGSDTATDANGEHVEPEHVHGLRLRPMPANPVQVFFLGFGEADVQIGRILAQATGAEYQGSTDDDLASVIEELSGYF